MRPTTKPPPHPPQINLPLRILQNPNHQPLLLKPQQQPLNKLLIPRNLPRNINRKNQPRKNPKQITKYLLRNFLNLSITNPRHNKTNNPPLILLTFLPNTGIPQKNKPHFPTFIYNKC